MDMKLAKLGDWFRLKGWSVEHHLGEYRGADRPPLVEHLLMHFPKPLQDYGVSVIPFHDGFDYVVWESYAGSTIGSGWTDDPRQILASTLAIAATCDAVLTEGYLLGDT